MLKSLQSLFYKYPAIKYKKGELIIRSTDTPQGIYYIKEGYVRIFFILSNGREFTVNILKPLSYFPMIWAIGNVNNNYYFQSMTNAVLYRAPKDKVMKLLHDNPQIFFILTKRILVGVNSLLSSVEHLLCIDAYQRIVSMLLILSRRFGEKKGELVQIGINLTHQDIASLVGVSRETASLLLKKLKDKKIIFYSRGKISIVSSTKLIKESSSPKD